MIPKNQKITSKTVEIPKKGQTIISNNTFESKVVWDSETIDTIKTVAQGLTNLSELFKSQNIEYTALRVEQSETKKS